MARNHKGRGLWSPHPRQWENVPQFAKRHYEAIAEVLRGVHRHLEIMLPPDRAQAVQEMVVAQLGLMLARDNKEFDSFRFAAASIVGGSTRRKGEPAALPPGNKRIMRLIRVNTTLWTTNQRSRKMTTLQSQVPLSNNGSFVALLV